MTNEATKTNTTTQFAALRQAVEQHHAEQLQEKLFYIARGYYPTWAEQHHNDDARGLRQYLTARRWEQYTAGEITRADAIEYASKRATAETDKQRQKYLSRINAAENAPDLLSLSISVEWVRSQTWGHNPHAVTNIHTASGWSNEEGRASGCGYDKRTAAIAEALNKSPSVLKMLYIMEEKRLNEGEKQTRRDFIGYGAGYGVLPYFEGGVGIESFCTVFQNCGYKFDYTASGRTFDAYTVTK